MNTACGETPLAALNGILAECRGRESRPGGGLSDWSAQGL
jgi:hypothetical protein